MSCNDNSAQSDIICLDSSQELTAESDLEEKEEGEVNDEVNESLIDESVSSFDRTLPPGVAPEGFILVDESVEDTAETTSTISNSKTIKDEPIFKVIFRDKSAAKKHGQKIDNFLTKLVNGKGSELDIDSSPPTLNIYTKKPVQVQKQANNDIENAKDNALFMIDNTPGVEDRLDIPTYGTKFEKVLTEVTVEADDEVKDAAPKMSCFNCLENHSLRDCPQPRNVMEINKNRKEFMTRASAKSVRYHVDDESKFDHFKPGILSSELRKALGISDNELPRHIYKMRKLGYPPGWLEAARLQHSGLNLYDSEGKKEAGADEEQGEIFCESDRDRYDVRKVYDFPGFNIPAPPGTIDAQWPSEQQKKQHSKEKMLFQLSSRKAEEGYQRRKMKRNTEKSQDTADSQSEDMEVEILEETPMQIVEVADHFIPPPPEDSGSSEIPPPPPPEELPSSESISRVNSPSLSDLEIKKQKLLESLESDSNSHSNPESAPVTPVNSRIGKITSVELGTPILQSLSPFTKLPPSEKFSKDICSIIHFENLPNSTGKYEQMTEILQKVRGVMSSNNQ